MKLRLLQKVVGGLYLANLQEWVIEMKKDNQPAAEYPETLPCPVFLEPGMRFGKGVKTRLVLDAIQRRTEYYAELEAMTPEERAEHDANIEAFKTMFPQPAPVVLKDHQIRELVNQLRDIAIEYHGTQQLRERISRVLRASMLQDGNHTEQHLDMVDHFGDANEKGNGGTLTNEGTIQAGNSPAIPDCWCRTCRPVTMSNMRFVVCPDCGNKRCPHANDHRNACTGSNEPGQIGSAYPAAPQQEGKRNDAQP